jgi:hypothetical protein
VCDGCELVKAPAKKIAYTSSQSEINHSKHTQIFCNSADNTGANPKRAISSVKYAQSFFRLQEEGQAAQKYSRREILRFAILPSRRHVTPLMNSLKQRTPLWLDFVSPKELPHRHCIDRN